MDIEFWGATREVTGSCFLLRAAGQRVLVECGLIQGRPVDEARNTEPLPFDPDHIDAVILTHAHLDHAGRLPLLVKAGFRGPIYAQRATRDLCRIMLRDAAYLNEREVEWRNRKRRRKGLRLLAPLYSLRDVTATLHRFRALDYDQLEEILPGVRVRLRDAGHILGSSIAEVWLREGGLERKLVFSGDLGHRGAPILRNPASIGDADLVIMESTYGDRSHRSWDDTWQELGEVLRDALGAGGNILIPAFAVGRTQELLYAFGQHYQDWSLGRWQVFLDSPMAIEATEVYAQHHDLYDAEATNARGPAGNAFVLPNLQFSRTARQSMAINRLRSGAIIIAGSGMCDGGRIKHHLKHNLWRARCHVLFVGYQAQGTLGRKLVDGAPYVSLWGETVRVKAQIHTIGGFSAHADQAGLLAWYGGFTNRPRVALVHGESQALETLRDRLGRDLQAHVTIPDYGMRLDLADYRPRRR